MRERTQQEADLALHAYGQRMRAAWDQRHAEIEKHLAAFQDAAEQPERQDVKIDAPKIEEPKIEAPRIEPPQRDVRDIEEPDR